MNSHLNYLLPDNWDPGASASNSCNIPTCGLVYSPCDGTSRCSCSFSWSEESSQISDPQSSSSDTCDVTSNLFAPQPSWVDILLNLIIILCKVTRCLFKNSYISIFIIRTQLGYTIRLNIYIFMYAVKYATYVVTRKQFIMYPFKEKRPRYAKKSNAEVLFAILDLVSFICTFLSVSDLAKINSTNRLFNQADTVARKNTKNLVWFDIEKRSRLYVCSFFADVAKTCFRFRRLVLFGCWKTFITKEQLKCMLQLSPNLKELSLSVVYCTKLRKYKKNTINCKSGLLELVGDAAPQISTFYYTGCVRTPDLMKFAQRCTNLQDVCLAVPACHDANGVGTGVETLMKNNRISHLVVAYWKTFAHVLCNCPESVKRHLETLILIGATKKTDYQEKFLKDNVKTYRDFRDSSHFLDAGGKEQYFKFRWC